MIKLFEKFSDIKKVKDAILVKAIETEDLNLVKFFIKKGYDINADDAIYQATYNDDILKYFLENNAKVEVLNDNWKSQTQLSDADVQKILIDFGYDNFINQTVGFNNKIKEFGQKYVDIIENYENIKKFNL